MNKRRRPSASTLKLLDHLMQRPRVWHYGYDLSRLTDLKSGTLYPILMRLSGRGILESKWQPAMQEGRPARHMYRLTATGLAFARGCLTRGAAASLIQSSAEYA